MLHNSTSTFGVCSRSRRHSFARTKPGTGLRQDYCICIIRDCVPRNFFCPTYESENSVCPSSPILLSFFHCHLPGRTSSLSSSSGNFTRVTLHLAPCFSSRWQLLAVLRTNSRRYRLPLSFPSSILSRPPSFYSLDVSSREEKNSRSAVSQSSDDRVVALQSATRKINVWVKFLT